ncbi:MAG: flagellar biosynthesis anti-sigma factor FlgM [Hyphomicrobiales bacterium]|nr:flagellar biosynthesis anti-sigma factor FlgM [Hyphomicrobiales bacterium]NBR12041.1 flagellar biosynthesis anti-sigma factor FlgM [Alphaproteobacteria bacterium]
MIDPIGSKAVLADPSVRKAPKADAKASAEAAVKIADASVVAKNDTPQVEVTITKGNGLSEPPFDYAKVLALKQQIANGDYKVDYHKLAQSMIDSDILGGGKK